MTQPVAVPVAVEPAALASQYIGRWQRALRLSDWRIYVSPISPAELDERASIDIDANVREAVIRIDPTTPADQVERSVLHELLHLRLTALEEAFRLVVDEDETARTWWHRAKESSIEALVDAFLPDSPRRNYRGTPEWVTAAAVHEA